MNFLFLSLIILLAIFLRFFQLDTLPISLFGDEVDIGYQAWSLITTGKDYMGNAYPIYFQSLIEWRLPGLVYLTAPIVGLFGPNVLSVRVLPAIFGVLDIYLIYLLVVKLFPNKNIYKFTPLIAAFLLAITPWHIHYSRAAFDVTLQLFLILSSILLLVSKKINIFKITSSACLMILSLYVYPTSVLFSPLIFFSSLLIFKPNLRQFSKLQYTLSFVVILIVSLPYLYSVFSGTVGDRIKGINIFNDQKSVDTLITLRTEPWVDSQSKERLFHNKAFLFSNQFASNYLTAFSTEFLFTKGDPNPRQSVGNFGQLPAFLAPFLILGAAFLLTGLREKSNQFILLWLLLAPVSSSFTVGGGNHATRLFLMLPPLVILSSIGIEKTLNFLQNKLLKTLVFLVLFFISFTFIVLYWHQYSSHYRYLTSSLWDHGYSQIFHSLASHSGGGITYINNTYQPSLIKFSFYTKYPPKKFQENFQKDEPIKDIVTGFSGFKFADNYYFGELNSGYSMSDLLKPGDVYLAVQKHEIPGDWDWSKTPPQEFNILGNTQDVFGNPLFTLIKKK